MCLLTVFWLHYSCNIPIIRKKCLSSIRLLFPFLFGNTTNLKTLQLQFTFWSLYFHQVLTYIIKNVSVTLLRILIQSEVVIIKSIKLLKREHYNPTSCQILPVSKYQKVIGYLIFNWVSFAAKMKALLKRLRHFLIMESSTVVFLLFFKHLKIFHRMLFIKCVSSHRIKHIYLGWDLSIIQTGNRQL